MIGMLEKNTTTNEQVSPTLLRSGGYPAIVLNSSWEPFRVIESCTHLNSMQHSRQVVSSVIVTTTFSFF